MSAHPTAGTFLGVFAALMVLLALTVWFALFDLGAWNVPLMLTIAIAKSVLIILYFMHVRYTGWLTWVVAGTGFLWLAHMMTWTLVDYFSRGWLPLPQGWGP